MKKLSVLLIVGLLLIACSSDDATPTNFGVLNPQTPQGIDLTITYPGGSESTLKSDRVIGWDKGQLLEGNYWRQLRSGNEDRLYLKINIPKSINVEDALKGDYGLRPNRLRLDQTGNLGSVQVELWFQSSGNSDEFNSLTNATGVVVLSNETDNYDIITKIDAQLVNKKGEIVKIKGSIWKDNAE